MPVPSEIGVDDSPDMSFAQRGSNHDAPHIVRQEVVIAMVAKLLRRTWKETGFGELRVESNLVKPGRVGVIICAGTYYRFVTYADESGLSR